MKKNFIIGIILFFGIHMLPQAQTKAADSVVINVGARSKITVVIKDKKDLETLKSYNFQSLMTDLISKIESQDTTSAMKPSENYLKENNPEPVVAQKTEEDENWKRPDGKESLSTTTDVTVDEKKRYRGTRQSISFDLGTNNYLTGNGGFTDENDLYTVRPWGSWYLGINSTYRTRMARTLFLEWGFGASMYNFKFQNDAVTVSSDPNTITFGVDARTVDFRKSQLSAWFVNASFIPVLDFGGNYRKPVLFDGRRADSFRIGFGPYVGYRIDSYARKVYKENGDKEKEKDHGSYHLNNLRYGLRLQLGFKNTDVFFNYDLNELFVNGKGPVLHAFSFGFSI
jgi:hypothetical protein